MRRGCGFDQDREPCGWTSSAVGSEKTGCRRLRLPQHLPIRPRTDAVSASLHLAWVGEGSERAKVIDSVACIPIRARVRRRADHLFYGGNRLFGSCFPLSASFLACRRRCLDG